MGAILANILVSTWKPGRMLDKGARLVRYSRGARVASTRFQFATDGSQQWRQKLKAFAYYVSERSGC